MPESAKRWIIIAIFVVSAMAFSFTKSPWCDEGYFGEPGYNLSQTGRLASVAVPPSPVDDPKTAGTDRYIFYAMPLHFVAQALWYRVFGFGIIQLRALSVLFGVIALLSWFAILDRLFQDPRLSTIVVALLSVNYVLLVAASDGRMDMMSASLGYLGLALYLNWRERDLGKACAFGFAGCAAAGLTHPIGGLIATMTLAFVFLWRDRASFHPVLLLWAAAPFVIFGIGWGLYIARDPQLFAYQFSHISNGRLSAWKEPFTAMKREVMQRWASPFGFAATSSGPVRLKALVLAIFLVGLVGSLFQKRIRSSPLPWIGMGILEFLALFESTKASSYLIYPVCYLSILTGLWLMHLRRGAALALGLTIVVLQMGGSAYAVMRDGYHREYLPAVTYLLNHRSGKAFAVAELSFAVDGLVDDRRLGYYNHIQANTIVVDPTYSEQWKIYKTESPAIYAYVEELLTHYHVVFRDNTYVILERNS